MSVVQAADTALKLRAAGILPRPTVPEPPDVWDEIVGIPLRDWMRATTPAEIEWLVHLRDHPMPLACDEPAGPDDLEVFTYESLRPVHIHRGVRRS